MAVSTADHAKHPASIAAGPYGHPFHPVLVTIPIGVWIAALVFDIASRTSAAQTGALVVGSQWLIAIGVIGALAAAIFGLMDLTRIPRASVAFKVGITHMTLNLIITGLFIANFFWRYASNTDNTSEVLGGQLALSAVGVGLLLISGLLGGTLAYRYGVRVADEGTQAEGFERA